MALVGLAAGWMLSLGGGVLSRLVPLRAAELVYARTTVRLTEANGGVGRYGQLWGIWRRARLTPGLGFFQPDFQCAEFVMRSLRAAGYNIATPPVTSPAWPNMVNVDRAVSYLMARGIAYPAPLSRLGVGDAVAFRYRRLGINRWGHIALVVGVHPLRLSAHDRNRWNKPLAAFPSSQAILGLHTVAAPRPPDGLRPLGAVRFGEIALRDPPVRRTPGGRIVRRLYLGLTVAVDGAKRASGSNTGWLHVRSGRLGGWVNGDFVTRFATAPVALPANAVLNLGRRKTRAQAPVPVRGAWGKRLYVDALGCPAPPWTGPACTAPYTAMARSAYPLFTVTARTPVDLSLSPAPGSLTVAKMAAGHSAAAEFVGAYAAVWDVGGAADVGGVLYAPASAFLWHRGGTVLFTKATRLGGRPVPPGTAASSLGGRLSTATGTLPLPPTGLACAPLKGAGGHSRAGATPSACLFVPLTQGPVPPPAQGPGGAGSGGA